MRRRVRSWVMECGLHAQALAQTGHVPVRKIMRGPEGRLVQPNRLDVEKWMRGWFAQQGYRDTILLSTATNHAEQCTLEFVSYLREAESRMGRWSVVYLPGTDSCMFAFQQPKDAVTARMFLA